MNGFGDVLTVLAAGGGLMLLLVMALAPLLVDSHRPVEREQPRRVVVPARRGEASAGQVVGGRA